MPCRVVSRQEAEAVLATTNEATERHGREYSAALREAGGVHRQTVNGITFRHNPLTDAITARTCIVCGSCRNVKPCGGCRTVYYCGEECQSQHWREHKKQCRLVQKRRAADKEEYGAAADFSMDKFLAEFPQLHECCRLAVLTDDVLPVLTFKMGASRHQVAVSFDGCKTMQDVDALKAANPGFEHMFRLDETPDPRLRRLVVVLDRPHSEGVTKRSINRLRVPVA